MKILIVGGVAGGASAATRARRLSESAQIVIIERGPDISYANCGMPYFIGGEIKDRGKLSVVTPARLKERFNLDVRVRSEVKFIDRAAKRLQIRDLQSGLDYSESYDKLILSPGAAPIPLDVPGRELPGIFTLRNLQDMDAVKAAVDAGAKTALVIGAGFIGLEMAENLVRRGLQTTVIERQPQVLPPLDQELTAPILDTLRQHGVNVRLGDSVERFVQDKGGLIAELQSRENLQADLVVVAIGVRPESRLAAETGLEIGPRGGIRVNRHLQTSDPDIYAVGDAIETQDFVSERPTQVPLAGPANRQGRMAADQIFGRDVRFRGVQGTAIVGVFDHVAAITGASEKELQRRGEEYRAVWVHPAQHAGYYPGAQGMTLKVLFQPSTGQILGASAVGGAGVDKRIDVLSVAIQAKMTVFDLEEMELCYAPQFGSAKDPVNMAGFVAAGMLRGDHPQIDVVSLFALPPDRRPLLLDVRTKDEFAAGHLPGAVNLPVDELRQQLPTLSRDREIVAYCQVGQRGYVATRLLLQAGLKVRNLSGGYRSYILAIGSGQLPSSN